MFSFVSQTFTSLLTTTASTLGGSYGLAIIAVTLIIRLALLPLTLPSLKAQKKQLELQPKRDELKKKYGHDQKLFAQKQLELYQAEGINPLAGCLPQLVQIGLFIIFYQVLISSLSPDQNPPGNLNFLWLNLSSPDPTFVLPILAAVSQLLLSLMIVPATDTTAEHQLATKTKTKKDDEQAQDMSQMAQTMQSQMVFIMPFITFLIALRFPSGLALYWVASTVFSLVQQYFVSGLGGLKTRLTRFSLYKSS